MKNLFLLFLTFSICLCLSHPILAQTFNESAGHHQTFRDWKVAETEHFYIHFPAHLDGIQHEAAAIAEASHTALSKNLDVYPDYKIRIYFSDMDEIMNGFAVPFQDSYTNIWVNVNRYANFWTGEAKWLRKVLAHELAHIYHFEAVKSKLTPFDALLGDVLLSDWTEGIAQYQTELWDSQRGDRWMRKAIFDNKPNPFDGRSLENGRLMYASGNAKVRYLTQTYGDSTLAQILAHKDTLFFGKLAIHDFPKAMEHVLGKSLNEFNEEWLKHMNVYYNSMAGYMDRVDSLGGTTHRLSNIVYEQVAYSPDTTKIAVVGVPSLDEPYPILKVIANDSTKKTTILARGRIFGPVSWSPDGNSIAFTRTARNRKGFLANDIFIVNVDSRNTKRITREKRAFSPVFSDDGSQIAFIAGEKDTDNIFIHDLESGVTEQITSFSGDVQLLSFDWNHESDQFAIARFDIDGMRDIILFDLESKLLTNITNSTTDDRDPRFSPDGTAIVYNSLRDRVPNIFYRSLENPDYEYRITNQFTGATLLDWLPADSTYQNGRLVIESTETKLRERIHIIDADVRRPHTQPIIPEPYVSWTTHRPPMEIEKQISSDPTLIQSEYDYNAFRNLTLAGIIPYPFIFDEDDYGFGISGVWIEPTGQHFIFGTAALSFPHIVDNSFFLLSYTNRQYYPTYNFNIYKRSFTGRFYGDGFFFEDLNGADLSASIPLFWSEDPFISSRTGLRLRFVSVTPNFYLNLQDGITPVESGNQADLRFSYKISRLLPHRHNVIHPLNGWGVQLNLTAALPLGFTDTDFVRPDLSAYTILPGPGDTRFYLYGRGQATFGNSFAQDYTGLARYDEIILPFAEATDDFLSGQNERVRGHREYIIGDKAIFGSLEYRIPFLPSLQTTILGAIKLGKTTIAPFIDAGMVWNTQLEAGNDRQERFGTGIELKNKLSLGGLEILHSVGLAQPLEEFGDDDFEIYYRVRASVSF